MFVEEKGFEIIEKNLYKNFVLHLCNLFDFGLLNASAFVEVIKDFDEKRKQYQQQRQQQPINELIVKSEENLSSTLNHF
jgi:polycomb protein SUZ12